MFRSAAAVAGRRAGWVGGPAPSVRRFSTEGQPEFTPNQAWLKNQLTDISVSSSKEMETAHQRVAAMDRQLSAALVKHRDTLDEANRQVNTTTWRIMVVFGSFALSIFHVTGKKN